MNTLVKDGYLVELLPASLVTALKNKQIHTLIQLAIREQTRPSSMYKGVGKKGHILISELLESNGLEPYYPSAQLKIILQRRKQAWAPYRLEKDKNENRHKLSWYVNGILKESNNDSKS